MYSPETVKLVTDFSRPLEVPSNKGGFQHPVSQEQRLKEIENIGRKGGPLGDIIYKL